MEDEGRISDHTAGIAATDGSWHHIAVTWSSHDGLATLYDNGHKVRPHAAVHASEIDPGVLCTVLAGTHCPQALTAAVRAPVQSNQLKLDHAGSCAADSIDAPSGARPCT